MGWRTRAVFRAALGLTAGCAKANPLWWDGSGSGSGSSTTGDSASASASESASASASDSGGTGSASGTVTSATTSDATSDGSTTVDVTVTGTLSDTSTGEPTTEGTTDATDSDSDSGTTTSGTDTDTDTDTDTGTDTDTDTGGPECACADVEVPLDDGIFVVSDDAQLWKFRPIDNEFIDLGPINCGGLTQVFSMAVDRSGYAWVMFEPNAGALRRLYVSNTDECEDPGYTPGQLGVTRFGMAFASADIQNPCETLYGNTYDGGPVSEGPGAGSLVTVDPQTLDLEIVGATTFNGAELTGTGDGRLYVFGGVNKGKLVEVDKTTGEYLEELPLGGLLPTNAFAFAFFAGDFYFFTESAGPGSLSKVTHFDYDGDKKLKTVISKAPIRVVGAGVSTCVPNG
ncbi:MAG: hypothetical protein R3A79_02185 [Nannocystaceae bacterium]